MTAGSLVAGIVGTVLLVAEAPAASAQPRTSGRLLPPDVVDCPRDLLTAYTGRVQSLTRGAERTSLEIRTDWDTAERVTIIHSGTDSAAGSFLMKGRPFEPNDWAAIESAPGRLRPGVRATAWVCDDGRSPIIDWSPAAEPPPPGR